MKGSWNWFWKGGSVLLLTYVVVRGFCTPLQPGLVSATPSQLSVAPQVVDLVAVGQPFATSEDLPASFDVVLRSGDQLIRTDVVAITPHSVRIQIDVPPTMPSRALDAYLFTPASGTLFLGNACFVEDAAKGDVPPEFSASAPDPQEPDLGFSFPYQPNIMESIRNLLWHVQCGLPCSSSWASAL